MNYNIPVKLTSPRVWRTYQGGSRIDAIHGIENGPDGQFPEEWILSVVNARNVGREHIADEGLCYLAGTDLTLRDYLAAAPNVALGAAHAEKFGATPGVLVKLLDSAERLTIQVHPDKQRAQELFHSPFGKTECWHILSCRSIDGEEPCIYLGFREGITKDYFRQVFHAQDIHAMLACLHRIPVRPGETYLVEGGVPHAIGAGCLLVEIQEPTDFTVRTERVSPKGLAISDRQCHQGLGFERMFDCFDYTGVSLEEALRRWRIEAIPWEQTPDYRRSTLIGSRDTRCFALEKLEISGACPISAGDTACGLYVLSGKGELHTASGAMSLESGEQLFVSAACDDFTITAEEEMTIFRCMGPQ